MLQISTAVLTPFSWILNMAIYVVHRVKIYVAFEWIYHRLGPAQVFTKVLESILYKVVALLVGVTSLRIY